MVAPLQNQGLINTANFDEPIDFTYFDLWHYWGRTTKFGTWMQGPDYTQWHGAYPLQETLADLKRDGQRQAAGGGSHALAMYHLATVFPTVRRVRIPITRDQAMLLMLALNELLLGVETYLAHSISGTIMPKEWIPIIFGPVAGILLFLAGVLAIRKRSLATVIASVIYLASIVVGLLGIYFHLVRAVLPYAPLGERVSIPLVRLGASHPRTAHLCPGGFDGYQCRVDGAATR